MENHKNRFAHIIPGGCMFNLESGIDWVQDPEKDDTTDEEYNQYNNIKEIFSTYSYCIDVNESCQQKKVPYIKEELFFDMDDVEIDIH
jgi:hypothetical protein